MWLAKALGTILSMIVFFTAYFWVLRHPLRPFAIMPLTWADRWIVFRPETLPLYFSLWVYLSLAPALLTDGRELISYGVAAVIMSVIGLGIFLILPTAVPPTIVDWSLHPGFGFLKSADAAGNACPSLHVAFAVFSAAWMGRLLRLMGAGWVIRTLNVIWCLGIVYSTMATRQHVFLDVLAGAALGAAVAWVHIGSVEAVATPRKSGPH
jgi:membrane-associated phospholipid phosphatase